MSDETTNKEDDLKAWVEGIISDVFKEDPLDKAFRKSQKTVAYGSIEEYTKATGKRFRMRKEQKERGLSRDQAFQELNENGELN
jgi:hypothetical protein